MLDDCWPHLNEPKLQFVIWHSFTVNTYMHCVPAMVNCSQRVIYCDQRASTSERVGSILFLLTGKIELFRWIVFSPPPPPPRGLAIPYMGNITIFGVQNGTCCVLVFVLDLKGKLTTYIMITFKPIFRSMLLNNM